MIVHHPTRREVFHTDDTETINDLSTFLVGEVVTSEGNPLMHTRNNLPMLTPFRCATGSLGVLPLDSCQSLFLAAYEPGIVDLFARRKRSKGFETDINSYLGWCFRQSFRFHLTREGDRPFAGGGTMDGACLDLSLDRAMVDHLETANLRETDTVIVGDATSTLREGEAVRAAIALEAWIARFLCVFFHTAEEGFESEIDTYRHMLQNLGMDTLKLGTFGFPYREGFLLLIERQPLPFLLIGCFAFLKQMVIEPATLFKRPS